MSKPSICVKVDVTNPGQYFACCGLLELCDRISPGAVGWFERASGTFCIETTDDSFTPNDLLSTLAGCGLCNIMSSDELDRLKHLKSRRVKDLSSGEKLEKKSLESLRRESPLVLGAPFKLRLDWFHDSRAGGSRFKTWAGQQSVIDIATTMLEPITQSAYDEVEPDEWLSHPHGHSLTFNFDADASVQGAPLDVGFSLDPLGMSSNSKPLLEFACFVSLQRFRPASVSGENKYVYATWDVPLSPNVASIVAAGIVPALADQRFAFPLLYRTKYLKSFLPASPIGET